MVVQVLVSCLGSPSLDVTLAAMRATSAFIQVCCHPGARDAVHCSCACRNHAALELHRQHRVRCRDFAGS